MLSDSTALPPWCSYPTVVDYISKFTVVQIRSERPHLTAIGLANVGDHKSSLTTIQI